MGPAAAGCRHKGRGLSETVGDRLFRSKCSPLNGDNVQHARSCSRKRCAHTACHSFGCTRAASAFARCHVGTGYGCYCVDHRTCRVRCAESVSELCQQPARYRCYVQLPAAAPPCACALHVLVAAAAVHNSDVVGTPRVDCIHTRAYDIVFLQNTNTKCSPAVCDRVITRGGDHLG